MNDLAVIGAQFGDEGKGKIVDILSQRFDVVARYQGGHNAGHTVVVEGRKQVLHNVPCGVVRGKTSIIGNGCVVDPDALMSEVSDLERGGIALNDKLYVSNRAHVILPHHIYMERLAEKAKGEHKVGTTMRGIGPAYTTKAERTGIRFCDIESGEQFLTEKLEELYAVRGFPRAGIEGAFGSSEKEAARLVEIYGKLKEKGMRFQDTVSLINELGKTQSILFEGAQACWLDVDHGTYPFATSSSATIGGAHTGTGYGKRIEKVLGITKAYSTRVGGGPLLTEMNEGFAGVIRERGGEYGASTGRPRRCAWFDGAMNRHATNVSGFDEIGVMKIDVLDTQTEIPFCVGYKLDGRKLPDYALPDSPNDFARCEPRYIFVDGWLSPTAGIRDFEKLPPKAQYYLKLMQGVHERPITMVSTGPDRDDIIYLPSGIA